MTSAFSKLVAAVALIAICISGCAAPSDERAQHQRVQLTAPTAGPTAFPTNTPDPDAKETPSQIGDPFKTDATKW